jgi:hypothetical protein
MRHPITKFLDGCGQWWHINTAFNEPPKKQITWCKIRWMGWPREKVVSICSTSFQRCGRTRRFTLSSGVKACTNHILYSLKCSRLHITFHTMIFGMPNSLLALATDLQGHCWNASHTLSILSSDTRGRPRLLPLHKHPVPTNCRYHLVMLFLCGAPFLKHAAV